MRANVDDQDWGHFPSYCYGWQQDWENTLMLKMKLYFTLVGIGYLNLLSSSNNKYL